MDSTNIGSVRRRWTARQRSRLLGRSHQSQLTLKQFAARHGVGLSTLSKWLRVEGDAVPAEVKFREVRLRHVASPWLIEVASPQGWIVRLQNGSDVQGLLYHGSLITRHFL